MMTCKKINDLVTDFLEHSMSSWDQLRFQFHLIICPHCRLHVKKMEQVVGALGSIPEDTEVPPEMLERFSHWNSSSEQP